MGLFDRLPRLGMPVVSDGREVARVESPGGAQMVAAAGSAIVSAAKVAGLLTRTGWGLARKLPGGEAMQREVQRLQDAALVEVRRILDVPEQGATASPDEQRAVLLIQQTPPGSEPLRAAMGELLDRAVEEDRTTNREYLYGNIISQLVPDEARILAALADGSRFAVIDVIAKPSMGRAAPRTILSNASSVGRSAGVSGLDSVPTYITRLHSFGLVHLLPEDPNLRMQYEVLATEQTVRSAEASLSTSRHASARQVRKALAISEFGSQFWAAADPARISPNGLHPS